MKKFFTLLITLSLALGPVGVAMAGHFYGINEINVYPQSSDVVTGYGGGGGGWPVGSSFYGYSKANNDDLTFTYPPANPYAIYSNNQLNSHATFIKGGYIDVVVTVYNTFTSWNNDASYQAWQNTLTPVPGIVNYTTSEYFFNYNYGYWGDPTYNWQYWNDARSHKNLTGQTWDAFTYKLGFGTGANFFQNATDDGLDFDTPSMNPYPYSTQLPSFDQQADTLKFYNGTVPNNGLLYTFFALDIPNSNNNMPEAYRFTDRTVTINMQSYQQQPDGSWVLVTTPAEVSVDGYDFTLRYYPTAADETTQPVPEPATMLLLGSGLIGLWGFRKKFKN